MLYTHYCTVGKYSLHQPESLVCFLWGGFLARAIDQILSRVDLRFFLPPSLPPYYSQLSSQPSHLNVVSASPVIILGDLDFQFSFFFLFRGGIVFTTRVYYLYVPITPFPIRGKERARQEEDQKKRKKKNELPRVCRIRTKTYIHTYVPTYVHT